MDSESESEAPKMPFFKKLVSRVDIDVSTVFMMLKGAIAPTLGLAAYQSDRFAAEYTTQGYLISIIAMLSLPILPRAKFVQNITVTVLSTCFAAAISLLQIQCAVAARHSSGHPVSSSTGSSGSREAHGYNAAAHATAGVWLFFHLYLSNTIRAYRPQLLLMTIQYCVFTLIVSTYAPTFPTMGAGMNFIQRLLKVFLTGQALATGVALFILPISSRMLSSKQMVGVLKLLEKSLSIHSAYLHGITTHRAHDTDTFDDNGFAKTTANNPQGLASIEKAEQDAKNLKLSLQQASQLFAQLKIEISFAKKEIGWGKLLPEDFTHIFTHIRQILLPVAGLSTFVDIMQSVKREKSEAENLINDTNTIEAIRRLEAEEWRELIVESRGPFQEVKAALVGGLTHITYVLELAPRPKVTVKDIENGAQNPPSPGDPAFAAYLKARVDAFREHREGTVQRWCEKKGIDVPAKFWEEPSAHLRFQESVTFQEVVRQKQNHQQLYLALYLESLLNSVGKGILDMVLFADSKVQDGTMAKNRFIFPGWRRIHKLLQNSFKSIDAGETLPHSNASEIFVRVGDALSGSKDPEHLPPVGWYQRTTNYLRIIPEFLGSAESAFGFRVAVAGMSLSVLAYLRQTSEFFKEQRGLWALIMIAISMSPHAGAGLQGLLVRSLGTFIATVASIAIWYMGDQKPAAILPLCYIYFAVCLYFVFRRPKHLITAVISIVTVILIIGYELQDKKLGTHLLETNGQKYYHIYLLAPYRLVTVLAGLAVAFIWTYFPYPITTHSTLRKDLGDTLFLMARYYSSTHATVEHKLRHGAYNSLQDKSSPIRKLDSERTKLFGKMLVMMNRLREHSMFTRYEPTFGGRFPRETYDELIIHLQSLFNYMVLINYSSQAFSPDLSTNNGSTEESQWVRDFRAVTASSRITSHELTSTLVLVSASVSNAQPLPPHIRVPRPVDLADQLGAIDPGILSVKHIREPCYAAFAVLEVASILIMLEMQQVLRKVKELVGEVDFSVHFLCDELTTHGSDTSRSSLLDINLKATSSEGGALGASDEKGKAD
ncbi:hypothetical protein LTR84_006973 [Exophiala bonariae]|uniref:ER transporter 6TM N-terminal domain-containing protein n=1 Tax=Exophiala bonariae TaxID=1690606 RepID=A0AAV9MZB1_9EURO|nr:hypothetical protein LTR84_006973 [Exophiala bonariae]